MSRSSRGRTMKSTAQTAPRIVLLGCRSQGVASRRIAARFLAMRLCVVLAVTLCGTTVAAQWLNYPAPDVPRLRDGKPDLSAPAPRRPDGKPDLDGIWFVDETPLGAFGERPAALRVELKPEDVVLT